jgi:cytochrome c oxidase assembly protein subunit 15
MSRFSSTVSDISPSTRSIARWLFLCCAMIMVILVLGGVTRLTHSGLSIVQWKPVAGILPPLSQTEWEETFRQYQQFPEYQKLNQNMTLDGFKSIFWLEFFHRVWGRLLGLVFFLPFLYFLIKGRISETLLPRLFGIFILGGAQGLMGWYMVKSGLVDRPDVSQYRLTAHLGLAFLIYGYIFWTAMGILRPRASAPDLPLLRRSAKALTALIAITVLSGGFVAGLDAGFAYNTFPLMGGRFIPEGLFLLEPPLRNIFENITTVQFDHRLLAIGVFLAATLLWGYSLVVSVPARTRMAFHGLFAAAVLQMALGISTLVWVVPVSLGAAHQAGALVLFTAALWAVFELRSAAELGHRFNTYHAEIAGPERD